MSTHLVDAAMELRAAFPVTGILPPSWPSPAPSELQGLDFSALWDRTPRRFHGAERRRQRKLERLGLVRSAGLARYQWVQFDDRLWRWFGITAGFRATRGPYGIGWPWVTDYEAAWHAGNPVALAPFVGPFAGSVRGRPWLPGETVAGDDGTTWRLP